MRGVPNQMLAAWVILLNLFISSSAFGQSPDEAGKTLEKRKIAYNDEEFISRAKQGDAEIMEIFLVAGINPDAKDNNGRTALMWASVNGHAAAANILLNRGADANAVDNAGMTPLMGAASAGRTEIVSLLLEKGANMNSTGRDGMTALLHASSGGYTEILNILMDRGADVNAINREGKNSLILAAAAGRTKTVKALLDRVTDIEARDAGGMTALMWAESKRHAAVVRLLKKASGTEIYSGPSRTLTNPKLETDVQNHIFQLEFSSDENCREHRVVKTDVLEYPSRVGINKWAEMWTIERCGERFYYRVEFRPDEKGGTYFKAIEEREPAKVEETMPIRY